jgi:hypothetical protein
MMMVANLVGFVVGVDGIKYMASQLVGSWAGTNFDPLCALFDVLTLLT